jgi:restriction system protein
VDETGRPDAADGNIDLRVRRDDREILVQCKAWKSTVVSVDEVRKLEGTVSREKLPRGSGALVTLSRFSSQAVNEGRQIGIELVDGDALIARIEKVRGGEPCPDCGARMIPHHSPRGWWLRCPRYPLCRGKRDLDGEPGPTVDLLLDPTARQRLGHR